MGGFATRKAKGGNGMRQGRNGIALVQEMLLPQFEAPLSSLDI